MLLELGPYPAEDVARWTKFARRALLEIESDRSLLEQVSTDVVALWRRHINDWASAAEQKLSTGKSFRWQAELECEMAEFLLHGLERCWHSPNLSRRLAGDLSRDSVAENHDFTMHVVQAFVDGLSGQGDGCVHYVDQIMASFGGSLD